MPIVEALYLLLWLVLPIIFASMDNSLDPRAPVAYVEPQQAPRGQG